MGGYPCLVPDSDTLRSKTALQIAGRMVAGRVMLLLWLTSCLSARTSRDLRKLSKSRVRLRHVYAGLGERGIHRQTDTLGNLAIQLYSWLKAANDMCENRALSGGCKGTREPKQTLATGLQSVEWTSHRRHGPSTAIE